MNQAQLRALAQRMVKANVYMTLATADKKPWAAPVFYCPDKQGNFYYASQMKSVHSRHILKNHRVAFAIFDSHQPEGTGNGVQGFGRAELVKEPQIAAALRWYKTTYLPMIPDSFRGQAPYRLFKITPRHWYVLDPDAHVDSRVEVGRP